MKLEGFNKDLKKSFDEKYIEINRIETQISSIKIDIENAKKGVDVGLSIDYMNKRLEDLKTELAWLKRSEKND